MSTGSLHETLLLLSSPETPPEARRRAEQALEENLGWLRPWLEGKFEGADPDDLDRACDHVTDRASEGTAGYRGENGEKSAVAWCQQVARNRYISLWRRRHGAAKAAADEARRKRAEATANALEAYHGELARKIVTLVHDHVEASHPPARAREMLGEMRLGLEVIYRRVTQRDQLLRGGYVAQGETDPDAIRRANNRLYQDRRRGRVLFSRLLGRMVAAGRVGEDEAADFAAYSRIPWPPAGAGTTTGEESVP